MWEHRLIEKMIQILQSEIKRMNEQQEANILLLDQAVDFFKTYADRTHHGKEENILFRDLGKKSLSKDHETIMTALIEEHVRARKMVGRLVEGRNLYSRDGSRVNLASIIECVTDLTAFYPAHIVKEDKHFFFPCLDYLSPDEQKEMLQEFWEFDRQMIHERYTKLVEDILGQKVLRPK